MSFLSKHCLHFVLDLSKVQVLELSGVAVVVALKLQHSIVIRGGHHVDELGGREQRRREQLGDVDLNPVQMGVTFAQTH